MIKIIAEIGWNHLGNMDLAEEMIVSAVRNGADICKFQTWNVNNLKSGSWDKNGRREIYKKAQLSFEQHIQLKNICDRENAEFATSISNIYDCSILKELDFSLIKIPSPEVNNLDLIRAAVEQFNIVLVSTGAAKWNEVTQIIEGISANNLVLMHCVSTYPCPIENINLPRLDKLSEISKQVGYSGHYLGIDDAVAAICRGAIYIEKHFTINSDLEGRDNKFSILPEDLKELSEFRNNYEKMNLDLGLDLQECEIDTFENYRGRWSKDA